MKNTIIIESIQQTDRNLVLFFSGPKMVGVNFWQGCNDMSLLEFYKESDKKLFNYIKREFEKLHFIDVDGFSNVYGSADYWEILDLIDVLISNYIVIKTRIEDLQNEINQLKKLI